MDINHATRLCGTLRPVLYHSPHRFQAGRRVCRSNGSSRPQRGSLIVFAADERSLRVVITGSTKGVGKALAKNFVQAGDSIIISSRSDARVQSSVRELDSLRAARATVKGLSCNVSKPSDVAALAAFATEQMGGVDVWINNAGTNSYKFNVLSDLAENDIISIIETNVLGVMLCCREAIRVMSKQSTTGHIFNVDGAGSDGGATPRFAAYGASKRGLAQLGKSLQAELKMGGVKNVCLHNLSPGMVTTELLMSGGDTPTSKFFINCLADPAEKVADELVPQVRRIAQEQQAPGSGKSQYVRYLTKVKAYGLIFNRLLFGKRKSRFIPEDA